MVQEKKTITIKGQRFMIFCWKYNKYQVSYETAFNFQNFQPIPCNFLNVCIAHHTISIFVDFSIVTASLITSNLSFLKFFTRKNVNKSFWKLFFGDSKGNGFLIIGVTNPMKPFLSKFIHEGTPRPPKYCQPRH